MEKTENQLKSISLSMWLNSQINLAVIKWLKPCYFPHVKLFSPISLSLNTHWIVPSVLPVLSAAKGEIKCQKVVCRNWWRLSLQERGPQQQHQHNNNSSPVPPWGCCLQRERYQMGRHLESRVYSSRMWSRLLAREAVSDRWLICCVDF